MADGKLNFDTGIDISGFKAGIDGISSLASKGLSGLQSLGELGINALKQSATLTLDVMKSVGSSIADLSKQSVELGSNFEYGMAKVSTMTTADQSKQVDQLSNSILELSNKTGIASDIFTEASYSALSAGVNLEDVSGVLDNASKLSVAGFTSVDTAVDGLTSVINAYGSDVMDADTASKIFMQTQNLGKTTVDELASSLSNVTPVASAMGVSFEQVGASIATITAKGTPTAQATTQLNSLFAELGKSGTKANIALLECAEGTKYAGMSFTDMMNNGATLDELLLMMQKSAEANGISLLDMFGSIEAGNGALSLVSGNGEKFRTSLEGMSTESDVVSEAYEKMTDTLQNKSEVLKTNVQNLGITVFGALESPLKDLTENATGYIQQLTNAFQGGGFTGLGSAIGDVISSSIEDNQATVQKYMSIGTRMIENIIEGISENSDFITKSIGTLLTQALTSGGSIFGGTYALGLKLVSGIASSLAKNSSKLKGCISEMLNSMSNSIRSNVPLILEAGIEILKALLNGIVSNTALISVTIVELLEAFINLISSNASSFIDIGKSFLEQISLGFSEAGFGEIALELLQFILNGINNNVFLLINSAENLIVFLGDAIVENLPMLAQTALMILLKIVNGIIGSLDYLLPTAISLIEMLAQFIVDNIPLLIDTAIEILLNLVYFIVDNLPLLITCAIQIIEKILSAISENTDKLVDCAVEILCVLAEFVIDNLDQLLDCVGELILSIIDFISQCAGDLLEGALTIIYKLVEYLSDSKNLEKVGEFITSLWNKIEGFISGKNWGEIGVRIVEGILSGLCNFDMTGYLSQSGNDFASNWVAGFKDIFGIHSPSRLMADEIGVQLTPGIGVGMEDALPDTLNSINGTMNSMVSGIDINGIYSQMQGLAMSQGAGSVPSYSGVISQAYQSSQDNQQNSDVTQGTVVVENYLFKNSQKLNDLVIKAGITENARSGGASI